MRLRAAGDKVTMPQSASIVASKFHQPLRLSAESQRAAALEEAGLLATAVGAAGGSMKEYYFNRLNPSSDGQSQSSTWGMGPSSRDAVVLKVSEPIIVLGCGAYGGNNGTYKPHCEIFKGNGGSTSESDKITEGTSEYTG